MSARGAEGILKAQGKIPDASKPSPVKKTTPSATTQPTDDSTPAKNTDKQKDQHPAAEKAGKAIGTAIGRPIGAGLSMGNEAAGFILGLLVWGWVVRPFLSGGVAGVKAIMMAKFFNKKPDGTEIP